MRPLILLPFFCLVACQTPSVCEPSMAELIEYDDYVENVIHRMNSAIQPNEENIAGMLDAYRVARSTPKTELEHQNVQDARQYLFGCKLHIRLSFFAQVQEKTHQLLTELTNITDALQALQKDLKRCSKASHLETLQEKICHALALIKLRANHLKLVIEFVGYMMRP